MKTVGIMTYFESSSLGANLQAFALQTQIEKLGCKAEIINYNRKGDYQEKTKPASKKDKLIRVVNAVQSVLEKDAREKKETAFRRFRTSRLKVAEKRYENFAALEAEPPAYDFYVTGSDQVWNPYTGVRMAYFLSFTDENEKKIAYAPSIGVKKIGEEFEGLFRKNVTSFRALSCRERVGAEEISRIIGKPVQTVLDPTLLLTDSEWDAFAAETKLPKKKYMLCYFLGSLKSSRKLAEKVAKEKGLEILDIPGSPADLLWNVRKAKGVGPAEFLYLVRHADFICTDSFHGTAFAINYLKPFLCFQRRGYASAKSFGSRLENILELTGLQSCLVFEGSETYDANFAAEHIAETQKHIEEQRAISNNYLQNALLSL